MLSGSAAVDLPTIDLAPIDSIDLASGTELPLARSTEIGWHLRRRPLRVRVIVRQFRSAPSYQIMELMISAAKGARINTFICGRLMGAPNGEVGRCCRSLDQNHTSNKIILPAPVRSSSTKAQRRRQTDQKEFKPSYELCSYPHRLGAWWPISVLRHRSLPKSESIPRASLIDKALGILSDSSRAKLALVRSPIGLSI